MGGGGGVFVFVGWQKPSGAGSPPITCLLPVAVDLSHSDGEARCHDNGLRGQDEDLSQRQ